MINRVLEYLDELFPEPKCELNYNKDYEFLIAIVLSAQTTDKRVNLVTSVLFKKYPSLKELSDASIYDIENIIREIGTFRKKSAYVKEIAIKLVNDGYDYIPNDRNYIESLPGVGRKTANVFLSNIYNEAAIAVDTHVSRVSKRLGFVNETDGVDVIEKKLEKKIPLDRWGKTHHQMVLFGRYYCKAINPMCDNCKIKDICCYKNKK
jgi:endonuclease-3